MRRIVCSVFALCCCSLVLAQEKTRSLSVELLGAQNVVGVNYDSRFKGNSGWGYRVGIGYGYGDNSSWIDQKISGVGVPLELNYLYNPQNEAFLHSRTSRAISQNETYRPPPSVPKKSTGLRRYSYIVRTEFGHHSNPVPFVLSLRSRFFALRFPLMLSRPTPCTQRRFAP